MGIGVLRAYWTGQILKIFLDSGDGDMISLLRWTQVDWFEIFHECLNFLLGEFGSVVG